MLRCLLNETFSSNLLRPQSRRIKHIASRFICEPWSQAYTAIWNHFLRLCAYLSGRFALFSLPSSTHTTVESTITPQRSLFCANEGPPGLHNMPVSDITVSFSLFQTFCRSPPQKSRFSGKNGRFRLFLSTTSELKRSGLRGAPLTVTLACFVF